MPQKNGKKSGRDGKKAVNRFFRCFFACAVPALMLYSGAQAKDELQLQSQEAISKLDPGAGEKTKKSHADARAYFTAGKEIRIDYPDSKADFLGKIKENTLEDSQHISIESKRSEHWETHLKPVIGSIEAGWGYGTASKGLMPVPFIYYSLPSDTMARHTDGNWYFKTPENISALAGCMYPKNTAYFASVSKQGMESIASCENSTGYFKVSSDIFARTDHYYEHVMQIDAGFSLTPSQWQYGGGSSMPAFFLKFSRNINILGSNSTENGIKIKLSYLKTYFSGALQNEKDRSSYVYSLPQFKVEARAGSYDFIKITGDATAFAIPELNRYMAGMLDSRGALPPQVNARILAQDGAANSIRFGKDMPTPVFLLNTRIDAFYETISIFANYNASENMIESMGGEICIRKNMAGERKDDMNGVCIKIAYSGLPVLMDDLSDWPLFEHRLAADVMAKYKVKTPIGDLRIKAGGGAFDGITYAKIQVSVYLGVEDNNGLLGVIYGKKYADPLLPQDQVNGLESKKVN